MKGAGVAWPWGYLKYLCGAEHMKQWQTGESPTPHPASVSHCLQPTAWLGALNLWKQVTRKLQQWWSLSPSSTVGGRRGEMPQLQTTSSYLFGVYKASSRQSKIIWRLPFPPLHLQKTAACSLLSEPLFCLQWGFPACPSPVNFYLEMQRPRRLHGAHFVNKWKERWKFTFC